MKAVRMPANNETLRLLSNLWCEEHVFLSLDPFIRTFYGAYVFFTMVVQGKYQVYQVFNDDGVSQGCIFGTMDEYEKDTYNAHFVLKRGAKAIDCANITTPLIVEDNPTMKFIGGVIPSINRAARMLAKRYGCKLTRTTEINSNGKTTTLHTFRKAINQ